MGGSCFHQPSHPFCHSPLSFSPLRNAPKPRAAAVVSCYRQENPKDCTCCARRVVVFAGFAFIPFLTSTTTADAIKGLAAENDELRAQDRKQKTKGSSSRNPFCSLVNQLGLLCSGLVAGLYASKNKEKVISGAIVESMNIELKEKEEAAIASVQRKFETELLNEIDARNKAVEKANRERQSLVDRLNLARNVITRMGKALENEKSLYKELATRARDLENGLEEAENEKRELQEELKEKLHSLAVLQEKINLLSSEIKDPSAEKDQRSMQKEYDEFKSSMEKKSASDAKLLGEKEVKIHRLEEQLQLSLMELSISKVLISDLTMEKDSLNETLNIESGNIENLSRELKITQDALQKSRGEASDLAEQLQQSRYLCLGLEAEISKVHDQFTEVTELLQKNNDEAKQRVMVIAGELRLATELLSKSNEKLETTAQELAAAVQKCDSLEKEVTGAHEKAESAALALQQEKMIISCLNKDLMALETQISNDMEARKRLEEAAKSVDEMNEYALIISKELELANSQILSLEDEKDELYRSLVQQKAAYQEARDLIMRLGKERESLQKRGEKLEQVLASAKGEILRLRRQINDDQKQKPVDVRDKADGKVTPKEKGNPQQEDE